MATVHARRGKDLNVLDTKEQILLKIEQKKTVGKFSEASIRYNISELVSDTHHNHQSIEKLVNECKKRKIIRTVEEEELNEMEKSKLSTRGRPPVNRYDLTIDGTTILRFLSGSPSADDGNQIEFIVRTVEELRGLDISRKSSET